jgi:Ni,Fe-hydrogenase I large subunit
VLTIWTLNFHKVKSTTTFIRNVVLTILVITMKSNQYKQNLYEKEKRRLQRIRKMTPEQIEKSAKNILNRSQRKSEIKKHLFEILKTTENLAIAEIQRKLGMNRNTFNYWINKFEGEGWIKRKKIETEGELARGQPKTLILNKTKIEEMEKYSWERSKKYEDKTLENYTLTSMFIEKILKEINEEQTYKQHKKLLKLLKDFKQDNWGGQMIFLLYSDYIKVDYKFSLTDKGKKALAKLKKKKKINA